MATARSSTPKKIGRGGPTGSRHRGLTKINNEKVKSAKRRKRRPDGDTLLHRLSLPSSPLLERIGAPLTDSGESDGEVERFLESVIGAPPPPPWHACSDKPTLALETPVVDPSSSAQHSPTQTLTLPSPPLGDTMPPSLTPAALEECRKHLTPVLLAAAQARDPAKRLDSEQCARLLSDDHCRSFFRQATQTKLQLSSLVSQKTPTYQSLTGSPSISKRDRVDEVDICARRTRPRFSSTSTVVSNVSRRDSDITLVDFPGGRLPPKAPRAMLLASQAKSLNDAHNGAPDEPLRASPTPQDRFESAASLLDLLHQAVKMFPALVPASQEIDSSNVPVGATTGDPTGQLGQAPEPPTQTTNFVSHLPTQPGIWFRQRGKQHAQILDVDIDVSDEMFYVSRERLRVHLRLCAVRVNAVAERDLQDIDDVIERRAIDWPKKGKLVVQVNPESERSKTWLPYLLDSGPLDVTACVMPGKNTFRFIQLSDLSEFTFVLAASPPPPEEAWRSWDWASLVERPDPRSPSTTDDPMNGLSKFARIPVTLRS